MTFWMGTVEVPTATVVVLVEAGVVEAFVEVGKTIFRGVLTPQPVNTTASTTEASKTDLRIVFTLTSLLPGWSFQEGAKVSSWASAYPRDRS